MSCGVGWRCGGSDPALLWLWCRLVATAQIRPLAWESPYARERPKKCQKDKKRKKEIVVKKPTLKTTLNKIGDEVIVVNEFLNKLELEIEYQEQTNSSLKELCESLKEGYKDAEYFKENIPPHSPQVTVTQNVVNASDLGPEEPAKIEEYEPSKKPPKEQKMLREM